MTRLFRSFATAHLRRHRSAGCSWRRSTKNSLQNGLVATLAAVVAVVGALASTQPAEAQEAEGESTSVEADEAVGGERVVLTDGHVDIGPRFVDGRWTLLVRDDTVEPAVWRRLSDVVLHVPDGAAVTVPDDPAFGFLGEPGADVWVLPQVQQPGIVWPGWNTQDPEVATSVDGPTTWTLTGVDGPGAFTLFVNGEFGEPTVLLDGREPLPQEVEIEPNTHAHGNWTFTTPGVYRLDMSMSARTAGGEEEAASATLQLAVGDATDPQSAFGAEEDQAGDGDAGADDAVDESSSSTGTPEDDTDASDAADDDSSVPVGLVGAGIVLLALGATAVVMRSRLRRPGPATPSTADGSDGPSAADELHQATDGEASTGADGPTDRQAQHEPPMPSGSAGEPTGGSAAAEDAS